MRKYFSWIILAVALLVVSGCGANKAVDENMAKISAVDEAQAHRGGGWMGISSSTLGNSIKGSAADLVIGEKIMATGKINTDGTISASRIMLGEMPNFGAGRSSSTPPSDSGQYQRRAQAGGEGGDNPRGERPDGNAGATERQMRPASAVSSISAVSGEILKKDDTSLVLKLGDGGSKIVFYSDTTEILIITAPVLSVNNE